jgi:uncharacterized protein YqeY
MSVAALKARLRDDLKTAMRARDSAAVSLLRTLAAALDNAEAVPLDAPAANDDERLLGAGPSEIARRELSDADIAALLERERAERLAAAEDYAALGKADEAARLRGEADMIEAYR